MLREFRPVRTAIIGCGAISRNYFNNITKKFRIIEIVGCSDIIPERSAARANEYNVAQMTNEEIWADKDIELVINLTYPTAHHDVTMASLKAGKHVYSEKMLATDFALGEEIMRYADEHGLYVGCAPDTFLGGGLQAARFALDSGVIGEPVAANITLARCYRHDRFTDKTDRVFVFHHGAGILQDVGVYYLTALVNLLGPAKAVCGFSQRRHVEDRLYANPSNPEYGRPMLNESDNNTAGAIELSCGVLCPILTTTEAASFTHHFEIFGSDGTLILNDPNEFTGNVAVKTKSGSEYPVPINYAYLDENRGLGTADMAYAIRSGRPPRASGKTALHMLEIAHGILYENGIYKLKTTTNRALPFAPGYIEYPETVMNI